MVSLILPGSCMQSILFVNSKGVLVIPKKEVLVASLAPIKVLPILFPKTWDQEMVSDVCEMPVIENLDTSEAISSKGKTIVCRSLNFWKKFLRAESVAINGVALKCWNKEYQFNSKPSSTLVIIVEGEPDQSGAGYNLSEMDMKTHPIIFTEVGA